MAAALMARFICRTTRAVRKAAGTTHIGGGCGRGLMCVFFSLNGAETTGVDVNEGWLREGVFCGRRFGVEKRVRCVAMDAERGDVGFLATLLTSV